jgi:hypothetical protein
MTELDGIAFICGCGHSGTSLLASMFAAHPEVHVPRYETNAFLSGEEHARKRVKKLERVALRSEKRYLVEKTPKHIRHLELARTVVPGARFVVPVRDGRDVAASVARRTGSAQTGIKRWLRDTAICLAEKDSTDVFVYRHEDLVRDPERVLREICDEAKIPFSGEMLNYHRQERLWFRQKEVVKGSGVGEEHGALRNWQVNQPIFDSSGRWKSELSQEDIEPLRSGSGLELMEAFGYLGAGVER